jgi:ABC-2 type transport system permease protein
MFDQAAREAFLVSFDNPAMIAMMGPIYGTDNFHAGAMLGVVLLLWVVLAVAVMNIFLVVRHTRADEERGRAEVVRSLPVGRLANLNAAMISAIIVNGVMALVIGLGIAVLGVESMTFHGSMLFGIAIGASGLVFAAIAALFSQLSSSSRGAIAYSSAFIGVFYLMRAAGDVGNEALSLISPLGLVLRTQSFIENNWWPIFFLLLFAAAVTLAAFLLNARRDIDQGFIPAKPGHREAPKYLRSSFGLAYRLTRGTLIAWMIIVFLLGASYGSIMADIDAFVADSEMYQQIIGVSDDFSTTELFITMVNAIGALFALIPLMVIAMKPRAEERENRAEHILARGVSRAKYMSGYVILSLAAGVLFQAFTALGLYSAAAAVMPDPGDISLGFLLEANFVFVPAIFVMIGLTVLVAGLLPKATGVLWGYFGASFFVVMMGRIEGLLPAWVDKLFPLMYVPQLPVDEVTALPMVLLTVIAAALTAAGIYFYSKRDTLTGM